MTVSSPALVTLRCRDTTVNNAGYPLRFSTFGTPRQKNTLGRTLGYMAGYDSHGYLALCIASSTWCSSMGNMNRLVGKRCPSRPVVDNCGLRGFFTLRVPDREALSEPVDPVSRNGHPIICTVEPPACCPVYFAPCTILEGVMATHPLKYYNSANQRYQTPRGCRGY